MVTRVVNGPAGAAPGRTVTVDGRAYLVLHLLPSIEGRALAARVTRDPPCRLCEAPMVWRPLPEIVEPRAGQSWGRPVLLEHDEAWLP